MYIIFENINATVEKQKTLTMKDTVILIEIIKILAQRVNTCNKKLSSLLRVSWVLAQRWLAYTFGGKQCRESEMFRL